MKIKLLIFSFILSILFVCQPIFSQDTDGDGTANNLDQDEDNDGVPDYLDGCSTIEIANTVGIGPPIVTNSSFALEETTITYTTTHLTAFAGYVAGNQGDAIRFQGPVTNETLELNFTIPVRNLTFKLTDFDGNEEVTVNAYDELNNLINIAATNVPLVGTQVDRTGNFFEANTSSETDGDDEADDHLGGIHFYFPDQVSRVVFIYNTGSVSSIRLVEPNYCLTDSDNDGILNYRDIDSDNDGIPDTVEAGGVDTDGNGYADNVADNNGNGVPDIYDFRCTNGPAASGRADSIHASANTSNTGNAIDTPAIYTFADIGIGGSLELGFSDVIPAGNNITVLHTRQSGSGQLPFMIERSNDGVTYSDGEMFSTSFDGSYAVLSYQLLGGNTQFIRVTNMSTGVIGFDYAKYNFGLDADCSGINGIQILNLDVDSDGIPNTKDLDSDGDGIFDVIEAGLIDTDNNGLADGFADSDTDGFNDNYDGDVGNDGTSENLAAVAIPTGSDTDSDGIPNSYLKVNTDGNNFPNPFDIDSDDDGIPDNIESQPSIGYLIPAGTFNSNGTNTAYSSGITPEDTDGDGTPDYLDADSDNDGTTDIQENGDANSTSNIDIDLDGLDDTFDSNTASFDVNDEITSGDAANLAASFGDMDGDLLSGGDLDFRDLFDVNPPALAQIDFDGIDDYVEVVNSAIDGLNEYTISCWFKYDGPAITSSAGEVFLMGQKDMFEITVRDWSPSQPEYEAIGANIFKTNGLPQSAGKRFDPTNWTHVAVTVSFDGTDTQFKVFRNGWASADGLIYGTINTNSNPFRIGIANGVTSYAEFEGAIDEVRIFDKILTDDQIKQMVYQEIKNESGNIRGNLIDKDIVDFSTSAIIPWTELISYYPMSNIKSGKIPDASSYSNEAILHNITTLQSQTAPMPYETIADGPWTTEATWLHGDIWDLESLDSDFGASNQNPEQWSIVHVKHDVTTSTNRESFGLFIDPGKSLTTIGDIEVKNNWYLQLDGTLDLADDSQLVQTETSDLVTSATGKILRRQEGNPEVYWYNYWSSPVGSLAASSLTNNNGPTNNTNNTPFSLNMLKDGVGTNIQFTNALAEVGKISTEWLHSFQNGLTYYNWNQISPSTAIQPGFGYTQKGTGNAGTEQQYVFEGKPNNGTILIAADDVDGDESGVGESVQDVTFTTSLIGNPYPSALDADEFIRDNIDFDNGFVNPIIQGTILLWEQWAGTSHYLNEYEGGYGYINLTGTERAYQHPNIIISDPTNPDNRGIKTPTKFIPVGQAFFVEVVNDGDIVFNNGQRVFKQEDLGESVFFRSFGTDTSTEETAAETQILRLEFGVSSGASRSFVLGFTEDATDGYDYGLDGGLITDPPADDMGSLLNGQQYVIQAFAPYTPDKEIDLVLHASGNFTYTLKSTEISNFPVGQDLFVKDLLTGQSYNLRNTEPYNFTSIAGSFTDRFKVVFQDPEALSTEEFIADNILIYVHQPEDKLYVKQLNEQAKELTITNMLGQTVKSFHNINDQMLENGISIASLNTGVYILRISLDTNQIIDKKMIIN